MYLRSMRKLSSFAFFFAAMFFVQGLSGCGKVKIVREVEILKVPENSWGVQYKYYDRAEMKSKIAKVGDAVVHVIDGVTGGSGSGFFISADGVLMTAAHVISKVRCQINSCTGIALIRDSRPGGQNEIFNEIRPLFIDKISDIAFLQVLRGGEKPQNLPFLKFDFGSPRWGQSHWAVGHPMGASLKFSEFRPQAIGDEMMFSGAGAVISGNSGGPVVTQDGRVTGLALAISTDHGSMKKDGTLTSRVYVGSIARLLSIYFSVSHSFGLCGVTQNPNFNPLASEEALNEVPQKLAEGMFLCGDKPAAREKSYAISGILPNVFEAKKTITRMEEANQFMLHYSLLPDGLQRISPDLLKDDLFMTVILSQYLKLARRMGNWVIQSAAFQNFKTSYEQIPTPSLPPIFANAPLAMIPAHGSGSAAAATTKQAFLKVEVLEECRAKLKTSSSNYVNAYEKLYRCYLLPEELSQANRATFLSAQKEVLSYFPEMVMMNLTMLSDYLLNGGEPLSAAELKLVLKLSKSAAEKLEGLRDFMAMDQLFYRFQEPQTFNNALLFQN